MTTITLPVTGRTGTDANNFADCFSNDVAIRDVVNGNLDNSNIAALAGIVDSKLASPNNSAYKSLLAETRRFGTGSTSPRYVIYSSGDMGATPAIADILILLYFAAADSTVSGLTQKLRIRAQHATGVTAPAVTLTLGLYPVTAVSAGNFTIGAVTAGSTVAFASTAANTLAQGNSGDFTIPSDGYYCVGVATSGNALGVSALSFQLQTRNV